MSQDTAKSGIEMALNRINPKGRLNLGFFGGEPLLEPELLFWSIKEARRQAEPLEITIHPFLTTNGTLLTDSLVEKLKARKVEVTVSIDGTRESHNKYRKSSDGNGSWESALKGLKNAATKLDNVGVNIVVSPETVSTIASGVKKLSKIVSRIDVSLDYSADWNHESLRELEIQFLTIGRLYTSFKKAKKPLAISFIDSKLLAIANKGVPEKCRCNLFTNEMTLAPDGNLIACERLVRDDKESTTHPYSFGNITAGINNNKLSTLKQSCDIIPESCKTCDIKPYCVFDCACNNVCRTGEPAVPDGMICITEKIALTVAREVIASLQPFL